ncbi:MAG: type II toxin-antitoxin system VapC family toxin [Pseudomonadota bacterium]
MKYLLDTHVFLWWADDDARLSAISRQILANPDNELLLSAASVWEISLKIHAGKIVFDRDFGGVLARMMRVYGIRGLAAGAAHALRTVALPPHHRDPFDRLLVAQSLLEGLPPITSDPMIRK